MATLKSQRSSGIKHQLAMRTAQQRNGLRKGLSIFLTLYNRANDLPKSIILLRALRYQGNNPNNFKTMTPKEKAKQIFNSIRYMENESGKDLRKNK